MSEQKNLFIAFALSISVLVAFNLFYERPRLEKIRQQQEAARQMAEQATPAADIPAQANAPSAPAAEQAATPSPVPASERVIIETPSLKGSMTLTGNRLDDLLLVHYAETIGKPESVRLLSPADSEHPYHASFGFTAEGAAILLPGDNTPWAADGRILTPEKPLTLTWDNGAGLLFTRTIAVDRDYMFTITQTVSNNGTVPVSLHPFALVSRELPQDMKNMAILHEGPIGMLGGELKTVKYKDLTRDSPSRSYTSTGGWFGITDKYWLVSLCPDKDESITARFLAAGEKGTRIQADYIGAAQTVSPGAAISDSFRLFAGAKKVALLDGYEKMYGIPHFDLAVDFGWYYFLTKPLFHALTWLGNLFGNLGLAILTLTVLVRLAMYPVSGKSFREMNKMKLIQPKIMELRAKYGEDKNRLQQELMELYKREKVNPFSGCLPMLLQIPVFFSLYKVLFVSIEMRHTPFFGWIHDLAAADPTTVFNLFGLIPWQPPSMLMLGAWPLLMGITMLLQQKMNPAPADPVQAKMMMFMPVMFTFMLAKFPAGLVIYWTWSNILSILQQWVMMRRRGIKPGFLQRRRKAEANDNADTSG